MSTQARLADLGLQFPSVLLPADGVDLERWAVIACDQFTSDQEYWDSVEKFVGDLPSTLHMMLPEIYLEQRDPEKEIQRIRGAMESYLERAILREYPESAVYVRRTLSDGSLRRGLVLAVDLESYDYDPGTAALVRASEETIPSRLPPRAAIREQAVLETPHVLVLYDDPRDTVTQALENRLDSLPVAYTTNLMMGGGAVEGRRVSITDPVADHVVEALETLRRGTLLFATGDGNHSLAAAKTVWEERKAGGAPKDDPFRYSLVELVNVHDRGLPFHPIHRVGKTNVSELLNILQGIPGSQWTPIPRDRFLETMQARASASQEVGVFAPDTVGILAVPADAPLPVELADRALAETDAQDIDYVHGLHDVCRTADRIGGVALILPEFDRHSLFPTVSAQGTLPRKAFSLGRARDKRYYLECRALTS